MYTIRNKLKQKGIKLKANFSVSSLPISLPLSLS